MIRLFITLYLVVLASFALFIVAMVSLDTFGDDLPWIQKSTEDLTRGSFFLLEKSIEGLEKEQRQVVIEAHKKAFDQYLGLFELSSLPLEDNELERLRQGEIVESETENESIIEQTIKDTGNEPVELSFIYKRVPNTQWVWRLNDDMDISTYMNNLDIGVTVEPKKFGNGTHYLIHQLLLKEPQERWQDLIDQLQPEYGLLLSLHDESAILATLENSDEKRFFLSEGKVINTTQGSSRATFVQRISESKKVLQIGPTKIPWMIRHFIHLVMMIFVFSIAMVLFLWVSPFWSNLVRIKQAADEFGSGNYSARIPYKKRSPIAQISKAFNAMAERTQRSIRSHKELTTAVSHELRTPVARMRFALEMLSATHDDNDKQRFVNDINKDIDELDLLLEELLTYARFDQDDAALKLSEEKLSPWISESMNKLMPLAKGTEKTLNYQIKGIGVSETAMLEVRLMSRVLDNLVQNALRYSHQRVEVTLTKDDDSYLLIVEDDGEGIPKEERDHIFDAFSRLDASRDRASGGFGLGLAIAERIVKGHQGSIAVHDSAFGGARFEVRMPAI